MEKIQVREVPILSVPVAKLSSSQSQEIMGSQVLIQDY